MATQPLIPTIADFLERAEQRAPLQLVPRLSPQQDAAHSWVTTGRGNAVVISVAGSGKTTLLLGKGHVLPGAVDYMRGSVAVVAYGKKNALEFEARLTERGIDKKRVRSGTAHSFGFGAWRRANPDVQVDDKVKWNRVCNQLQIVDHLQPFVRQLVSLAKQRAIGIVTPFSNENAWWDIVDHFDLVTQISNDDPDFDLDLAVRQGVEISVKALLASNDMARQIIDFDDMPYIPVLANCSFWENDWLVVDEAQDTNPARRALYKRMLKRNGRALFVGDPCQAIYGFTGADNDSLDLIKQEFRCAELPLTVTYRCPKAVVKWAQQWVSHIQAHESNALGSVEERSYDDLLKRSAELNPVDAIVCRNTKPLVELAFQLIRRHVPCHVEGKAIGEGLLALVNRWKVKSLEALTDRLQKYLKKQTDKLKAADKEESAAALEDRVGTVIVIIEAMPAGSTVADLRQRITDMFKDNVPNLTLCTAHRSKGLEWGDVYLLGRNKFMPSPWAKQKWQQEQEDHLIYVAGTRAMKRLIEVPVPVQEKKA